MTYIIKTIDGNEIEGDKDLYNSIIETIKNGQQFLLVPNQDVLININHITVIKPKDK